MKSNKLIEIEMEKKAKLDVEKIKHKNKLDEIEQEGKAKKEIEDLKFDYQKQMQRIRNADIQRTQLRKY